MRWILCAKQLLPPTPPGPARQGGSVTALELQPSLLTPPCPLLLNTHRPGHRDTHLHTHTDRNASCMILSKSLRLPKPQVLRVLWGSQEYAHLDIQCQHVPAPPLPHPRPFPWEWRHGHSAFQPTHLGTHVHLCSPAQPHMQHAHTSLLINLHGSGCTCVYKVGGLWQCSQDPKRSPHPSTSSFLSLGWTPEPARPQADSVRTSFSLLGKCQCGKEDVVWKDM